MYRGTQSGEGSPLSQSYIITDVGSTTTKAVLIGEKNGEFRLLGRGEAPTTVELPYEDVTYGVINAVRDLEDSTGRKLLCEEPGTGCPLKHPGSEVRYLSTSSAGGGLQVLVFGVMKGVSAESASRAALGAGAIAPKRAQAALMLINAFQPVGVTHLAIDSIFMMPNLGVLSQLEPEMALDVLERDCFVRLGPVVAPEGEVTPGEPALAVTIRHHSSGQEAIVNGGDIHVFPLQAGDEVEIEVEAMGGLSIGGGSRAKFKTSGGVLGLIADCRGRPLKFPKDPGERAALVSKWQHQIGAYAEGCR